MSESRSTLMRQDNAADRTIHARCGDILVVRYDRAGKWYAESTNGSKKRRPITLGEAVEMATKVGAYVYLGKPGGGLFDHKVKAATPVIR